MNYKFEVEIDDTFEAEMDDTFEVEMVEVEQAYGKYYKLNFNA